MIMVDSSVWIDYFTGADTKQTEVLDNTLGQQHVAIGDLILTEVLQGFRHDKDYNTAKSLFNELALFELLGKEMALKSADNFRAIRKKGVTIRKTADVIIASFCIASFCIEKNIPLLFSDKDFKPFVKHLGLTEA